MTLVVVVFLSLLMVSADVVTMLSALTAQIPSCETFVVSFAQAAKIVAMTIERYLLSLFIPLLPSRLYYTHLQVLRRMAYSIQTA